LSWSGKFIFFPFKRLVLRQALRDGLAEDFVYFTY